MIATNISLFLMFNTFFLLTYYYHKLSLNLSIVFSFTVDFD